MEQEQVAEHNRQKETEREEKKRELIFLRVPWYLAGNRGDPEVNVRPCLSIIPKSMSLESGLQL